ncbi:unnamed protein product [Victoria cruziana]
MPTRKLFENLGIVMLSLQPHDKAFSPLRLHLFQQLIVFFSTNFSHHSCISWAWRGTGQSPIPFSFLDPIGPGNRLSGGFAVEEKGAETY